MAAIFLGLNMLVIGMRYQTTSLGICEAVVPHPLCIHMKACVDTIVALLSNFVPALHIGNAP